MSLYLKVSNSLENLADLLIKKIRSQNRNVFTPITIVTQTPGINLWLRERIATQMGIAANLHFITPNDIVFRVFEVLGGQYQQTISRETMVWLLYDLMGEIQFARLFPHQWAYFQTPSAERDKKRMGMALKVADLFDQYQIYRQDAIKEWNNAPEDKEYTDNGWQEYLWKMLKKRAPKAVADKTEVRDFIHQHIEAEEFKETLQNKFQEVYLFGMSIFTNYHLDIIKRLSVNVPVYFFLINPAPNVYWVEDVNEKQMAVWKSRHQKIEDYTLTGNPLLTNWGKVLRNTYLQLFSHTEDSFNNYNEELAISPQPDTLLHKVQLDIYENRTEDAVKVCDNDLADETITFHSNYTIAGEVDALYQYLVHLIDQKKKVLAARDIMVMVSDINKYAPYISAVFDNAPQKFLYKIADTSVVEGDNIFSALKMLLELNENDFTSENVLQLLESALIRKRFHLTDLTTLRELTRMANIRFGIEGAFEDETYTISWKYGLQRLMYGICMSGEPIVENNGPAFFPLDAVEGNSSQQVIRFCHFIEQLIKVVEIRREERAPLQWKDYILGLVHNLIYQPDTSVDEDYYLLSEQLAHWSELETLSLENVSFEVFRLNFLQSLESTQRSSLFINDGITFCSLIPMRSVPFKIIAVLGLDGKKFPRRENPVAFSLLAQSHQLGDRNVKDNDKHLFLETVLSARDFLYLSYIGQNVKNNAALPPSVLVEELLDRISKMYGNHVEEKLITKYPLHTYSNRYNDNDPNLYRYEMSNQDEQSLLLTNKVQSVNAAEIGSITLRSIVSFFINAPKTYYNRALSIYYNQESSLLEETEDFALNQLQAAILKSEMLSIEGEKEEIQRKWKLTGKLPLKNVGQLSLEDLDATIMPVTEVIKKVFPSLLSQTIQINLLLKKIQLVGELTNVYGDCLLVICSSRSYLKKMVEAYIKALAGIASGAVNRLLFIVAANDKDVPETIVEEADLQTFSQEKAQKLLENLVSIYLQGLNKPYPFAETFYRKTNFSKIKDATADSLRKIVEDQINAFNGPPLDPYIQKEYERKFYNDNQVAEKYNTAFHQVILPMQEIFSEEFLKMKF